jgi:hypothetical protein
VVSNPNHLSTRAKSGLVGLTERQKTTLESLLRNHKEISYREIRERFRISDPQIREFAKQRNIDTTSRQKGAK